ncbi:MAG: dipeptidase [Myxococcota bacterium]
MIGLIGWLLTGSATAADADLERRVERVLKKTPLIDGHNDVPWQVRSRADLSLDALPLDADTSQLEPPMHTDWPRLREGQWGGVFWSVWVPTDLSGPEAVQTTLEQIDVVHRMVAKWPKTLQLATTADEIRRAHRRGRVASLVGIEGGHSMGDSLSALRMLYDAGARYMTLTHWRNTAWADAATDAPVHDGLTAFGEDVVRECNRLGLMVDLAHVSEATMADALDVSKAPVIFSHSGARGINPHPRNVPDAILDRLPKNGGIVMVDFLPSYVSTEVWEHRAAHKGEMARLEVLYLGDPEGYTAALAAWEAANPTPRSTLAQVADHIDYLKDRIGVDHIGIGTDFDGMRDQPDGLDDVSQVPNLFVELLRRGYSDADVAAIAGGNLLRVMKQVERQRARMKRVDPIGTRREFDEGETR